MSTINKKPFIQKLLESLTDDQLSTLAALINGSESATFKSLVNPSYKITDSFKGVHHIALETKDRVYTGYLMYNNTYCAMVCYLDDDQALSILEIDLTKQEFTIVREPLTITELRSSLIASGASEPIVDSVVDALIRSMHVVSNDPSSPNYYVTLGVPESMVGHLVHIDN